MRWLLLPLVLVSATCPPPARTAPLVPGAVSVSATRQADRLSLVVANGTETVISYHPHNMTLERRVLWGWVAVRYATLGQWWRSLWQMRTMGVRWPQSLPAQHVGTWRLPHAITTFAPGRYRVCVRYGVRDAPARQEACSARFRLPPA